MLQTISKDSEIKDGENKNLIKIVERPTFILKTREGENRAVSPSQRNGHRKDSDMSSAASAKVQDSIRMLSICPEMNTCIKFMDENMQLCENSIDFLHDQQDFLVVGCLGAQGVGKSTIMSQLTSCYSFLQTAEMLKPSSTTVIDQDYVEYYPHIVFLHNKAELQDFMPTIIEEMKDFYNKVFSSSRLQIHSGIDMNHCSTESGLNLFLIPPKSKEENMTFYENNESLIDKLRTKIHGVPRNSITPSVLTEKNWYHYVSKIIEVIKKSHLSSEYGRLMP